MKGCIPPTFMYNATGATAAPASNNVHACLTDKPCRCSNSIGDMSIAACARMARTGNRYMYIGLLRALILMVLLSRSSI